jgi:hypothetical protein
MPRLDYESIYTGTQVDAAVSVTLSVTNWQLLKGIYTSGGNVVVSDIALAPKSYVEGLTYIPKADANVYGLVKSGSQIQASAGVLSLAPGVLAWSNISGIPQATSAIAGVLTLATVYDANTGIDDTKAITPYTLNAVLEGLFGLNLSGAIGSSDIIPMVQSAGFVTSSAAIDLVDSRMTQLNQGVTALNNASGAIFISAGENLHLTSTIYGGVTYLNLSADSGLQGPPGPEGAQGPPVTLSGGFVSTVATASDAQVEIVPDPNVSGGSIVNLWVPEGAPGSPGGFTSISVHSVYTVAPGSSAAIEIYEGYTSGGYASLSYDVYIPAGSANVLSMGSVSTVDPGSSASAAITGASPSQTIELWLPQGSQGEPGPANSLSIGNVSTLNYNSSAYAYITGLPPAQKLELGIPQGVPGSIADLSSAMLKNAPFSTTVSGATIEFGYNPTLGEDLVISNDGYQIVRLRGGFLECRTDDMVMSCAASCTHAAGVLRPNSSGYEKATITLTSRNVIIQQLFGSNSASIEITSGGEINMSCTHLIVNGSTIV